MIFFDHIRGFVINNGTSINTQINFNIDKVPTIIFNNTDRGMIITEKGEQTFANTITFNSGLTIATDKILTNNGTISGGIITNSTINSSTINNAYIEQGMTVDSGDISLKQSNTNKIDITSKDGISLTGVVTVNGNLSTSGSYNIYAKTFYARSDKRLKENIKDCNYGIEIIDKIKVKEYNFIGENEVAIGCIAQELNEILPQELQDSIVAKDNKYLAINDSKLIYFLINAVKELKQEIEKLKNK